MDLSKHSRQTLPASRQECAARPLSHLMPVLIFALTPVLCGCAGVVSSKTTTSATAYTISGNVSPSADGAGATITLSGASAASTTANSSGSYSFTGLVNGNYALTPARSGFSFTPASQSVTVNGASQTGINFTAAQQASHSVNLSWQASTSSVAGYNVYRATTNGGPYSKINPGLVTSLHFADASVTSGNTYYYVSTAVDSSGSESSYSNQATAQIP